MDLLAALATGTVGAFALVRSDISDTLPGVAIAISLVPPLAVVGLLLGVQRWSDAAGAALLFGTNVAAIIATGTVVFLVSKVRHVAHRTGVPIGTLRGRTLAVVAGALVVLAIPLSAGTYEVVLNETLRTKAEPIVASWATQGSWEVRDVEAVDGRQLLVTAIGSGTAPDPRQLRQQLDDAGLADADLRVIGVVGADILCPAAQDSCQTVAGQPSTDTQGT